MIIPPIPIHDVKNHGIPTVPFYSQFSDIHIASWKKVGCGIASLAMIIDYYRPGSELVDVDTLLKQGLLLAAYDCRAGWIHNGLITLSKKYGLTGETHDVSSLSKDAALLELKKYTDTGPVMVSIHYKFNPKSSIPHLIVIDGIKDNIVYYNDPAEKMGHKEIKSVDFQNGWKKKFIVIRPANTEAKLV